MELNEEEAKDFLLCRIHNFLYDEFKDTEDQLEYFLDQSLGFNPILFQGWIESYFVFGLNVLTSSEWI